MNNDTSNLFLDTVLDEKRKHVFAELVPLAEGWYLAGGTALALRIGHRFSYDFDFFSQQKIDSAFRQQVIKTFGNTLHFTMDSENQLTFFTHDQIKITFAMTPHTPIEPLLRISSIASEGIADIAADKAFTVGRRGAFRDYVDLFFLLNGHVILSKVISDAQKKYAAMFEEKLFLEQLDYMDDITDVSVEFVGKKVTKEEIQAFLHGQVRAYLKERAAAL